MSGDQVETRRPGRPTTSSDGGVREVRKIRYSEAEWAWIQRQAAEAGVSASEFVRRRSLDGME